MRPEGKSFLAFLRHQPVAAQRFASAFGEHGLGDLAGVVHDRRCDIGGLVADQVVGLEIDDGLADMHDRETLIHRRIEVAHVGFMTMATDHVSVAERHDVRGREHLFLGYDAGLGEEGRDGRECHRIDGPLEIFAAQARLQSRAAVLRDEHMRVAAGADGQREHVTGIDEVWILDLRIDLPDLGPEPRVLEEHRRNVPQRVATLHGVVHWRVRPDELRRRGRLIGRSRLVHGGDGGFGRRHVVRLAGGLR